MYDANEISSWSDDDTSSTTTTNESESESESEIESDVEGETTMDEKESLWCPICPGRQPLLLVGEEGGEKKGSSSSSSSPSSLSQQPQPQPQPQPKPQHVVSPGHIKSLIANFKGRANKHVPALLVPPSPYSFCAPCGVVNPNAYMADQHLKGQVSILYIRTNR